jgi:GR25 family glycosyltransferase involved in LPS biosynthesis
MHPFFIDKETFKWTINMKHIRFAWKIYSRFFITKFVRFFERKFAIRFENIINSVIVIHMRHRYDRFRQIKSELSRLRLNRKTLWAKTKFMDAVDGKNVHNSSEENHIYEYNYLVDDTVFSSDEEHGIALSHINVWKHIVDNKIQTTLILEDDVYFNFDFLKKILETFHQLPQDFDMLYLSYFTNDRELHDIYFKIPEDFPNFQYEEYSKDLLSVKMGLCWLSGYVLSYEGAKKLLKKLPANGPIDLWINYQFKDMNVFAVKNILIDQRPNTISDNYYSACMKDETYDVTYFEKLFGGKD